MIRSLFAFVVLLFLCSTSAYAQVQPTGYIAKYYNAGATNPVQTETIVATAAVCNQTLPTGLTTVNPTRLIWDDIANVGKVCIYTEATAGPLFSLPIGANYEGTLTATNAAGASAESTRAPFSTLALPSVPTNYKVAR